MNRVRLAAVSSVRFLIVAVIVCSLVSQVQAAVVKGTIVYTEIPGSDYGPATIDRVTFDVTAGAIVNFDILAWELDYFTPTAGDQPVDLNGDGEYTLLDTQLVLFDSGANYIRYADTGPLGNDGSVEPADVNFTASFTTAGTYFVTIGGLGYSEAQGLDGYQPDAFQAARNYNPVFFDAFTEDHADWELTLTAIEGNVANIRVDTAGTVPEPTSFVVWVLLSGIVLIAVRRGGRT